MTTTLDQVKSEISRLTAKSELLLGQISAAQAIAGESAQCSGDLTALRQQRNRLLAQIHLGRADDSLLTVIDKQLEGAEAAGRKADQVRQGAEGAAQVLTEERGAIQAELSALHTRLPGLLYAEHCRHAAAALGPFKEALAGLASTHAILQGRLIACDKYADPRAGRNFSAVAPVSEFRVSQPGIPGHNDVAELIFDMAPAIADEVERALSLVGAD